MDIFSCSVCARGVLADCFLLLRYTQKGLLGDYSLFHTRSDGKRDEGTCVFKVTAVEGVCDLFSTGVLLGNTIAVKAVWMMICYLCSTANQLLEYMSSGTVPVYLIGYDNRLLHCDGTWGAILA